METVTGPDAPPMGSPKKRQVCCWPQMKPCEQTSSYKKIGFASIALLLLVGGAVLAWHFNRESESQPPPRRNPLDEAEVENCRMFFQTMFLPYGDSITYMELHDAFAQQVQQSVLAESPEGMIADVEEVSLYISRNAHEHNRLQSFFDAWDRDLDGVATRNDLEKSCNKGSEFEAYNFRKQINATTSAFIHGAAQNQSGRVLPADVSLNFFGSRDNSQSLPFLLKSAKKPDLCVVIAGGYAGKNKQLKWDYCRSHQGAEGKFAWFMQRVGGTNAFTIHNQAAPDYAVHPLRGQPLKDTKLVTYKGRPSSSRIEFRVEQGPGEDFYLRSNKVHPYNADRRRRGKSKHRKKLWVHPHRGQPRRNRRLVFYPCGPPRCTTSKRIRFRAEPLWTLKTTAGPQGNQQATGFWEYKGSIATGGTHAQKCSGNSEGTSSGETTTVSSTKSNQRTFQSTMSMGYGTPMSPYSADFSITEQTRQTDTHTRQLSQTKMLELRSHRTTCVGHTFEITEGASYRWQFRLWWQSADGASYTSTYLDDHAQTSSRSQPPLCWPGHALDFPFYQRCEAGYVLPDLPDHLASRVA